MSCVQRGRLVKTMSLKKLETHCFDIMQRIGKVFTFGELHYLANGIRGTLKHEDGKTYEIVVRELRMVEIPQSIREALANHGIATRKEVPDADYDYDPTPAGHDIGGMSEKYCHCGTSPFEHETCPKCSRPVWND